MDKPDADIKAVFFDMGKVILHFDHRGIVDRLLSRADPAGRRPAELFDFLFDYDFGLCNPYDEGLISSEDFFREIDRRFPLGVDYPGFKALWTDIFTETAEVSGLVRRVRKRVPAYLLSNINELHWLFVRERYGVLSEMDGRVLSFEVKAKKPKKEIFEAALARAGVSAPEAVFIDDMEENTAAARGLEMRGITFSGAGPLARELERLGLIGR